jgi:hypothetical protein
MKRRLRAVLLLLSAVWVVSQPPAVATAGAGAPPVCGTADGLASWLCHATFDVPPLAPIPLVSGFFTITVEIEGLKCGSVRVGQLQSATSLAGPNKSVTLGIDGVSLNCSTSEVKVNIERRGHAPFLTPHAQVAIAVEDGSLGTVLSLPRAPDGLPAAAANLTVTRLAFGKLEPKIKLPEPWGFLDGAIDLAVKEALGSVVKRQLPALLESLAPTLIDPLLRNLSGWFHEHSPPEPRPEPPRPPPREHTLLLDWSEQDSPLRALGFVASSVIGADGPAGLNGLIRLLTGGTGNITLDNHTLGGDLELPTM